MIERTPLARKGQRLYGPDGQGYTLTRDVFTAEPVEADTFEPFGGAPAPVAGTALPAWLSVICEPGGVKRLIEAAAHG